MRFVRNLVLVMLAVIAAYAQGGPAVRAAGYIELPGPKGKRFDYLTVDPVQHHLFATHLGAGMLYVVDLKTNKVIKSISGLPGIEGVEIAPDAKKVYTSNWFKHKHAVIDL